MPSLDRNAYPARFNVIEKICEQCGNKYYASRNTAKYCSNTCRVHAHTAKMGAGGLIHQKQSKTSKVEPGLVKPNKEQHYTSNQSRTLVLFIPATSKGEEMKSQWNKYFPNISFDEVWHRKWSGFNKPYFFEAHWDKGTGKPIINGFYAEFGIYVYQSI